MSSYQRYGFAVDQYFSVDQALPNATSVDSTNTITLNNTKGDDVHVVICAGSTPVELAGGATLEIRPIVGTTTTPATILPSILLKESVQTDITWASGEMICQFVIPAALIGANRYMKLTYVTSADESADKVDAFTVIR